MALWEKGQSGNPNGRPKKEHTLTDLAKAYLQKEVEVKGEKKKLKELYIQKVTEMALKGDHQAIKLLWNYIDGMPTQKTELSGQNGDPIENKLLIEFINSNKDDSQVS